GFIHAKVFVSDNSRAVVGTINLDYRSLYHHFECATYLYRTDSVLEIEEDFQATKAKCHRVSTTDVKNLPFHQKALGLLTKLVAPVM
ncbi:MAG: phospholipase D-like domain-containing protein, partial [Streptococcus salivarius]|nr:phospholipase D-like domain-containing protein [Streptococcus salivarius]